MKQDINNEIIKYLRQYNPSRIGLFGSYSRDEDGDSSDIDILVSFNNNVSLFDLGGMKQDLSELLNRQVDIVTERSLNKRIRKYVFSDLKIIFG